MPTVTDNFNRANGGLGSNWSRVNDSGSALEIISNAVEKTSGGYADAAYTGATFGADQYSQAKVDFNGSGNDIRLLVRSGASAPPFYMLRVTSTTWEIYKQANTGYVGNQLASGSTTFSTGDVAKLEVIGSTLKAYKNGSLLGSTTDSSYTSGYPGIGAGSAPRIDDFEAADIASAPNAPTGVTVGSITATSASVSWTDASSDETGFKVRYAPSPYSSWTTATGSVAASPYTVTGLSDGTSYKAGVAAFNGNGDSTWAESGVFTTTALTRLRPSADTSKGSWSASSGSVLYSMIDEANADDTDYITAATNTTCKIKLENGTDPVSGANHLLRVRARGTGGTLRAELVQSATPETTIASWSITYTASFTDFDLSLTSAQADAITDYSALYVKLISS